ncbi:MAG: hypothetical protein IPI93_10605 [Sphingobacteriaceae bacterium]|nr:hypothetical protein [Sphingobacteriaceae bacterium]
MTKIISIVVLATLLIKNSYGQDFKQSGLSFALASGIGFTEIKKMNGGGYADKNSWDFKYKPLYWSAAFAVKRKSHEFGIEYEQQKYQSDISKPAFSLGTMREISILKFHFLICDAEISIFPLSI